VSAGPLKVMIMGAPAAGKGTQCEKIVHKVRKLHSRCPARCPLRCQPPPFAPMRQPAVNANPDARQTSPSTQCISLVRHARMHKHKLAPSHG